MKSLSRLLTHMILWDELARYSSWFNGETQRKFIHFAKLIELLCEQGKVSDTYTVALDSLLVHCLPKVCVILFSNGFCSDCANQCLCAFGRDREPCTFYAFGDHLPSLWASPCLLADIMFKIFYFEDLGAHFGEFSFMGSSSTSLCCCSRLISIFFLVFFLSKSLAALLISV